MTQETINKVVELYEKIQLLEKLKLSLSIGCTVTFDKMSYDSIDIDPTSPIWKDIKELIENKLKSTKDELKNL